MKQDYDKLRHNLRQWLLGREYHIALAAMELGLQYHTGTRKDGVTPEFQHQVSQATFCRTLDGVLMHPEETLATIFLHDIVEDCEITPEEVLHHLKSKGAELHLQLKLISSGLDKMTNQYGDGFSHGQKGIKKEYEEYYGAMEDCPVASICKGMDRMHNHQSMIGVFTHEKQRDYIKHTEEFIIPMLKVSRKNWTRQEAAYTNVKHILQSQIELVEEILKADEDA